MKLAIFGVGAMGSLYAGLLADAGHEVHAIDPWQAHIDAINTHGLRVEGASGDRTIRTLRAATDARAATECDFYIIATKASAVVAAARIIAPLLGSDSLVVTIQNGLGAAERIAEHLPAGRVLLGVAEGFGASMRGPGHMFHSAMKRICFGEIGGQHAGITPRLKTLVGVWSDAGFQAEAEADLSRLVWEKYICNVAFSAPCTVFDCTLGELMADTDMWHIATECAAEAYEISQRLGVVLPFADPHVHVAEFGVRMPGARPSMLLDHHAQRRSEIDAINGMVVELGRELGIATPYNETLSTIVRRREAEFVAQCNAINGIYTVARRRKSSIISA